MSLIHKALKKAEGEKDNLSSLNQPSEEFVGEKAGLKSQITPRTIVLFVVAALTLVFVIYKKFYHVSQPAVVIPQPVAEAPQPAPSLPSDLPMDALVEEGKKLYGTGNYDEALTKFLEASIKNPSDAVILNNIGLIYKKKNNLVSAEEYYKKALAIKPDYPECLNNLGVLEAAGGDALSAVLHLKKALALDSTYADAYFNLAVLNDGEGNYRGAISNYKQFLQYTDTRDEALIAKVRERIEQISE